jgi:hypothetical protein
MGLQSNIQLGRQAGKRRVSVLANFALARMSVLGFVSHGDHGDHREQFFYLKSFESSADSSASGREVYIM